METTYKNSDAFIREVHKICKIDRTKRIFKFYDYLIIFEYHDMIGDYIFEIRKQNQKRFEIIKASEIETVWGFGNDEVLKYLIGEYEYSLKHGGRE